MEKIIAVTAIALLAQGCTTLGLTKPEPAAYNDRVSRATNIAWAGGIKEAHDVESKLGANGKEIDALIGFGYAGRDLGIGSAAGMAASLLIPKPKSDFSFDTLIAWIPVESAATPEAAQRQFSVSMIKAVRQSLDALGTDYKITHKDEEVNRGLFRNHFDRTSIFSITSEVHGCPAASEGLRWGERCHIGIYVHPPVKALAPAYLGGMESWLFGNVNGSAGRSSLYFFVPKASTLDELAIYQKIGEYTPENTFVFVPAFVPKRGSSEASRPPVLIGQSETLRFTKQ